MRWFRRMGDAGGTNGRCPPNQTLTGSVVSVFLFYALEQQFKNEIRQLISTLNNKCIFGHGMR
jgi:hypothetical protein